MTLGARIQPVLILCAALMGLVLGNFTTFGNISTIYIEIFLMMLLYVLFVTVDLKSLKKAFTNIKYTFTAISINFIVTPIIAYILGNIFFSDSIQLRIGLLMLLVTPCTDWYLVFTGLSKGNVDLNMSILPINLILQVMLMPVYLFVFIGSEIDMNIWNVLQSMILVLVIPFALSVLTNIFIKNKVEAQNFISNQSDNLQLIFLCCAVIVMFASESTNLFENSSLLIKLFLPLIIFFTVIFFISRFIGKMLKFEKRDIIALNFTTLARNSPLSLAIAVVAFPNYPLVSLALVVGPLIELPILSIISNILLKWNTKGDALNE